MYYIIWYDFEKTNYLLCNILNTFKTKFKTNNYENNLNSKLCRNLKKIYCTRVL